MSYQANKNKLKQAFDEHLENIRARQSGAAPHRQTRVTILYGPAGSGKTTCVNEFAAHMNYQITHLDCSCEPADFLAIRINNAIQAIHTKNIEGCILHIDNIDDVDDGWCNYLEQFCNNQLSAEIEIQSDGKMIKRVFAFDRIPEQVFIVGESHGED